MFVNLRYLKHLKQPTIPNPLNRDIYIHFYFYEN